MGVSGSMVDCGDVVAGVSGVSGRTALEGVVEDMSIVGSGRVGVDGKAVLCAVVVGEGLGGAVGAHAIGVRCVVLGSCGLLDLNLCRHWDRSFALRRSVLEGD